MQEQNVNDTRQAEMEPKPVNPEQAAAEKPAQPKPVPPKPAQAKEAPQRPTPAVKEIKPAKDEKPEAKKAEGSACAIVGTPRCGAIFAIIGAILALLFMTLGFWRGMFIAIFAALGYFIGASRDKAESIKSFINRIIPQKTE